MSNEKTVLDTGNPSKISRESFVQIVCHFPEKNMGIIRYNATDHPCVQSLGQKLSNTFSTVKGPRRHMNSKPVQFE